MTLGPRNALGLVVGACMLAGLASCGEEKSNQEEDRVADVIRTAATSTDPGHCTSLLTRRFVEQTELALGEQAIRSCRQGAKDAAGNPKSVSISNIDVSSASATATVAFRGGDTDGQTLNLMLIKQRGQWKVDYIESFARFHREKFLKATRRSLVRPPGAVPAVTANCISRRLDRLSDREIQRLVIGDRVGLFVLVRPCLEAQQGAGDGALLEGAGNGGRAAEAPRPAVTAPRRTVA